MTPLHDCLSDRQEEVLELLAEGLTDKEIAARLGCSERTARGHTAAILTRLGAANRAHAVAIHMRTKVGA